MSRSRSVGRHVVLMFVTLFFAVPFYMVAVNAFKPKQLVVREPLSPPTTETFTLENFVKVKFQAEDMNASPAREVMRRFEAIGLPAYAILRSPGLE